MLADSLGSWVLAPLELSRAWFTGRNRAGIKDDGEGPRGPKGRDRSCMVGWAPTAAAGRTAVCSREGLGKEVRLPPQGIGDQ